MQRHSDEALVAYLEYLGVDRGLVWGYGYAAMAALVVVGMVSNGFSIADPSDPGMLDVVGFDTATPQLISDFARSAL